MVLNCGRGYTFHHGSFYCSKMRKCGQNCGWDTNVETSKSTIAVADLNLKPWFLSYNLLSSIN